MAGVVIQAGLVVNSGGGDFNADSPIIGYQQLVTAGNVTATSEDLDHPAAMLANPVTHLFWRSAQASPSSEEYITVLVDNPDDIDYVGIAKHNFATAGRPVSIEAQYAPAGAWTELVSPQLLATNAPVIFRFTPQSVYAIRLKIGESVVGNIGLDVQLAVMYVGKLLLMQRRLYVGHTPITMGRQTQVINQWSISGNFLGRIITGEKRSTQASFLNLTPDWYRTYFEPFVIAAQEIPFFWGWRPGDYPLEVGYGALTGDIKPSNQRTNGMMQVSFDIEAVS